MNIRIIGTLILLMVSALLSGGRSSSLSVSAENQQKRIRFQIRTIGEQTGERRVLAQTTIEGLPGTDFNIKLETGNFKMQARFLSDLLTNDKLKIRAQLDTRRFYGYSPINLPLYEEDKQKQSLELGFNETIVLLPFGRNGAAETLKIEITPTLLSVDKTAEDRQKLTINFDKQIPSGEIFIEASKIPHRFQVEAILLADGKLMARGESECLLEEEQNIVLQPVDKSDEQTFTARVTIDKFSRNRPQDLAGINFAFYRNIAQSENQSQPLISNGSGVGALNDAIGYLLNSGKLPGNKKYELKFRIRLAAEEK